MNIFLQRIKVLLDYQKEKFFLWCPFIIAFGAALFFSLSFEPTVKYPIFITILLLLCICVVKKYTLKIPILFLFGFFYSMS
ncbi:MAG: hypothetical protein MJ158_03645, partial [Alphaproteobacteria bacterium]|nr:hypothetical protein [Alphaproteobacteria bacterium]